MDLCSQDIDQEGLKAKIERTLQNLEKAPKEKQRPVFTNLVKFIEIHPMKIKIGMYAPTKEQMKATGTDGTPSPGNQNQNLSEKEGTLIHFDPNRRAGSSTVGSGAGCRKLPEPGRLVVSQTYKMTWDRIYLNLTEVARLRWVERWSLDSIALHFATTKIAIKERLRTAKLNPSRIDWSVIDPKHGVIRPMKKRSIA